ncbi:hypothetical protein DUI87_05217 [Hirundo rustica rustica]|uniref:Uncharacterized protein n=1 Tax=Hirundo rustica rustica TaxID=333673 RepID=A0A3M0L192_HIRRU|nr:hypothetical protein DUI87_05217 [Hirundo rustica rustica]
MLCPCSPSASQEQFLEVARGQRSPCSLTFGQLACAQESWLQDLQDDFLTSLYSCLASKPTTAVDPEYSILFFSKYDARKLLASLTAFSQQFSQVPLSLEWSLILMNGLWERLLRVPGIGTPPVLLQWLREGLEPFLVEPRVFGCLRAKDVSCEEFRQLVAALDGIYSQLPVEEQRNLYAGIKHFLTQDESSQKCYSEAIPSLNSTAWFRNYLGSFLEHATVEDLQLFGDEPTVASSLLRDWEDFSPAVLGALGQAALGLSVSSIQEKIPEEQLEAALPALGSVRGWSAEQSRALVSKTAPLGLPGIGSAQGGLESPSLEVSRECLEGDKILDGQSLAELGTLVGGLNSSTLWSLSPEVVLEAIQLPGFAQSVDSLPSALKRTLVEKVSSRADRPTELVKLIPNALASYIPKSLLVFGEEEPDVQDLNDKPWTRDQAAMFFADVVKAEPDFSRLSQSVLQGFTCAAAGAVGAERFQELAKAMRKRKVRLGQDQKIPGTQVSEESAEVLGRLLCDLGGDHIRSSGGRLLEALSHCGSFLPEQEEAIRDVLSAGNTTFG